MDYMEGLFLGSLWSDTDYENRRHINLFILYGVVVCGIVVLSSFTGQFADLLGGNRVVKLALYLLLFLASPFLSFRYFRYPVYIKIPILLAQGFKYFIMTILFTTWTLPFVTASTSNVQEDIITFLNNTLESSTQLFADSAGTFSTVLGVITGGVYIVFLFAAIILLAILIPGTVFLIFKLLQFGYDKLVSKFILGNLLDR